MVDYIGITEHATKRMKERCGLNKDSSERLAKIAYEKGLRHKDVTGNIKKWMDGLWFSHKNANQMRLYGDKVYIFNNEILITVMQIPNNLQKEVNKKRNNRKDNKKGGND